MSRLTIRARIWAGFAGVLVLMGIVGWVAVGNLGRVNGLMGDMYQERLLPIQELGATVAELRQLQLYLVDDVLTQDKPKMDEAERMIAEHEKLMFDHLAAYSKSTLTQDEKELLEGFNAAWPLYRADRETVLRLKRESREVNTITPFLATARQKLATLDDQLDRLAKLNAAAAKEAKLQGDATYSATLPVLLGILFLALLVALATGYLLARSIAKGIGAATEAAEALSRGDLEQQIRVNSRDEIGKMIASFNGMIEYLRSTAEVAEAISRGDLSREVTPRSERDSLGIAFARMSDNLRQMVGSVASSATALAETSREMSAASGQAGSATQQIAATIQEVARGNHEESVAVQEAASAMDRLSRAIDLIARGAVEQAKSMGEASHSVAELNGSISQVAVASGEVASATKDAQQAARSGAESVQKTIQGMAAIKESTVNATSEIQDLDRYSEQINSIVETIDDIAEQTNLLALNAAIEAARAGEHGRGFAVVADEVRKLAERASSSTREIAQLVAQVQKETQEAVAAIQRGMREVESGSALAEEAGVALQNILSSVQSAAGQVTHIAYAVSQMEGASQRVVGAVDSVSTAIEESRAATEEMAASSRQVSAAMEKVAAVSEETSASAEEVSASTEETSAQVQQMVAQAQTLAAMAEELQAAVSQFQVGREADVIMRRRRDDWGEQPRGLAPATVPAGAGHAN